MMIITGTTIRDSFWVYSHTRECSITFAYVGSKSYCLSILRMVWIKLELPFERIWYNRKIMKHKGTFIVFDADITMHYLRWLKQNSNAERLIFYYWNTYREGKIHPDEVRELGYEVWSFDENDCMKYNMAYNPQMYFASWYEGIKNDIEGILYDVVFVGRDKFGRIEQMDKIIALFQKYNIKFHFYFVAQKWYQRFKSFRYSKYLNFQKMIEEELKGQTILDFYLSDQSGLSIRVFDALCNNRKLITNNFAIKQFDFYSKENIFVLGDDDNDTLVDFIQSKFVSVDKGILESYSVKGWIKRFEEKNKI